MTDRPERMACQVWALRARLLRAKPTPQARLLAAKNGNLLIASHS
jgi:hypothetical protein